MTYIDFYADDATTELDASAVNVGQLVTELKGDDILLAEDAYQQISEQLLPTAVSVARRFLGSEFDAQECVQDTFTKVLWQKRNKLPQSGAEGYVITAVRNEAITRQRRVDNVPILPTDLQDEECSNARAILSEPERKDPAKVVEIRDQIDFALSALKPRDREIAISVYLEGKPHADVAEELGMKTATVGRRVGIILAQMREKLESEGIYAPMSASAMI